MEDLYKPDDEFDPSQRRSQKHEARMNDCDDLETGRISSADLARRNGLFSSFPSSEITFTKARARGIGR